MTTRAALVLGFCLIVAAFLHGGIWAAGHDFVVNRFTGHYEFVPSDEEDSDAAVRARCALTTADPDGRVGVSPRRR